MVSSTQYAWGEEETADVPFTDVKLTTEEYEDLIECVHNKIKAEYKDDETCRIFSKLLCKLVILANH